MPILDGLRKKSLLHLPSSGGEVVMWEYPLVGDVIDSVSFLGSPSDIKPIDAVVKMIESWDFTDKSGKNLEINEDNVRKLPVGDFILIAQFVEKATNLSGIDTEQKKNTLDNSI